MRCRHGGRITAPMLGTALLVIFCGTVAFAAGFAFGVLAYYTGLARNVRKGNMSAVPGWEERGTAAPGATPQPKRTQRAGQAGVTH